MKSFLARLSVALVGTHFFLPVAGTSAQDPTPRTAPASWKELSLREKIGQTVIILTNSEQEKELGGGSLRGFFAKYPVSGVFVGSWKFEKGDPNLKSRAIREQAEQYQAATRTPLFLQEDFEQGPGSGLEGFTHLPILMALGATRSESLAYEYGKTLALESRALGLNWLLNPVADLHLNFLNPLVSTRALTDDPELAIRLLKQQIKGMHDHGLISTLKHFPGDGVDFRDQHQVTTVNSLSKKQWWATYGRVYRETIRAGAASIMVGHISLPAFQKEKFQGHYLPASLSKEVINDLLKKELGFKGVVISDALNMGGMQSYFADPVETQLQAFKAGTDLMLWPSLAYIDALEVKIKSGDIPMARLDDAVSRVWALKERFGLVGGKSLAAPLPATAPSPEAARTARGIAENSITLVRDRKKILPLQSAVRKKVLLVTVVPAESVSYSLQRFETTRKELEARGFQVDLRANLSFYENDLTQLTGYDAYVFAFNRHPHSPIGSMLLSEPEALTIWSINALPKSKVISVSFGDPYVHSVYMPLVDTCINVYSDSLISQASLVKALVGEIPFKGISPVRLEIPERPLATIGPASGRSF